MERRKGSRGTRAEIRNEGDGEDGPLALETDDGAGLAVGSGSPRVITITGTIDADNVRLVAASLAGLNHESSLPIVVQIASSGGSVQAGWALHELFVTSPAPVITVGLGYVGSAATVAFQGGVTRFITANTVLMVHEVAISVEDAQLDMGDLRQQVKEMAFIQRQMVRLFVRRTGLSRKKIIALCAKETEFTAKQAVRLGFADKLVLGRRMPKARKPSKTAKKR